ncbi:hypothetical protein GS881_25165 [Rhodococcus hoagii]|nr:hypothetical protein [Prescottella equi]
MIADDFFKSARDDVWGGTKSKFDMALIKEIRAGSVAGRTDIEIAIALSQLVHDELQAFGTEGGQSLNDAPDRRCTHSSSGGHASTCHPVSTRPTETSPLQELLDAQRLRLLASPPQPSRRPV